MKLGKNFLDLLQDLGFKQKGQSFYFVTPVVLKQTSTLLVIYCGIKDDGVFLSDNAQVVEAYDAPNIDFKYLQKHISSFANKTGVDYDKGCLIKKVNQGNFVNELSDFIKFIVLLEKYMETNL